MRSAKFDTGQKVKVISVTNQHLILKYPDIEESTSKIGTIVEKLWIGLEGLDLPNDNYVYTVLIDDDDDVVTIPEDALVSYSY
jgi:hypothetical protein